MVSPPVIHELPNLAELLNCRCGKALLPRPTGRGTLADLQHSISVFQFVGDKWVAGVSTISHW